MPASSRLVGRRTELLQLQASLREACAGRGSVVLLRGELGIGKTRLLDELRADARAACAILGHGRWYESQELPAYTGFQECLLQVLADDRLRAVLSDPSTPSREIARLGPEFATVLGTTRPETVAPDDDQYRLWRSIRSLIQCATALAPVVLTLDDLQWADPGSLALISYLSHEIGDMPVLIIGAYRDDHLPPEHPLHAVIPDLVHAQALRWITLDRLSQSDVATLAGDLSGSFVATEIVDKLYRQTSGNPLFVSEIVRHLLSADTRSGKQRSPRPLPHITELEVPEELRAVIAQRLAVLSPACHQLLSVAAVIGREFEIPIAERAGDLPRDALLCAIDEAIEAAVFSEPSPGRYAFAHPLYRTVVYDKMPSSARLSSHLACANTLEALYGAQLRVREVAAHLLAAGSLAEPPLVAARCLAAAQQERGLFAFDEALAFIRGGLQAVDQLAESDPVLKAQLLVELGYAETALGHPEEAARVYKQALVLYEKSGRIDDATNVRRWLAASLAHYGKWADVLAVTREALKELKPSESYSYVGLVGNHAMALMVSGASEECGPWVDQLLDISFDDPTRAVANHVAAGWYSWSTGYDRDEALGALTTAERLFLSEGLDGTASQVFLDDAVISHLLGDFARSADAAAEAERLATASGRVSVLADLHAFRSLAHVQRGEWAAADQERARWRTRLPQLGGSTVYGQLAERGEALECLWRNGPLDALDCLTLSFPLRKEPAVAQLRAEAWDREGALAIIHAILQALPVDGQGLIWLGHAHPTVTALRLLGCNDEALRWTSALARHSGCLFAWGPTDLELASLAAVAGRWQEADAYFERAADLCRAGGLRPFLGVVCFEQARALLSRKAGGDRKRALGLLERAAGIFQELGLEYIGRHARAALAKPGRGRTGDAGPGGLTPREQTVLELVAEGLSNGEIAARLYVAEGTVANHLQAIYRKAGATSRHAAVAWARREGLIKGPGIL